MIKFIVILIVKLNKVLKNKKGILDQSELLDYERERSLARLVTLSKMLLEEKIPK